MTHDLSYRRILHRMGYYNYQRGLIYHHLDEEGSWDIHLKNCRDFILESTERVKPGIITILGSGWLLDLPLTELSESAGEINLVDIIHPPEVKNQVGKLKNVVLREEDVSGGLINELWQKAGRRSYFNKLRSIEDLTIPEYTPGFNPGMIISLNILTQLETLPVELLRKKSRADKESLDRFSMKIQLSHISFLKKHRSVLITDTSELVTGRSGDITEIKSVHADLPEAEYFKEWTWNFDGKNSDYYRKKSVFKVRAMLF